MILVIIGYIKLGLTKDISLILDKTVYIKLSLARCNIKYSVMTSLIFFLY